MRILLRFLGGVLLLSACEEDDPTFVRLVNASDVVYDQVTMYGVAQSESFGTLAPGDTSEYRLSPGEYGLPSLILRVGSDTIPSLCILFDKAPPPRLSLGLYTYEIALRDVGGGFLYTASRLP